MVAIETLFSNLEKNNAEKFSNLDRNIMEKFNGQNATLDKILTQACLTNGRVNNLENWKQNITGNLSGAYKMAAFVGVLLSFLGGIIGFCVHLLVKP